MPRDNKTLGAYFTPEAVAAALVRWVVRDPADLLLDPSSGDGRFVALHRNSVGVERDPASVAAASRRAPHATIVEADFFTWASGDRRRFDCAAGNPPFIRYQRFTGATRRAALDYCRRLGVTFSGLSSSWAPFIVAAASKLRPAGAPGGSLRFDRFFASLYRQYDERFVYAAPRPQKGDGSQGVGRCIACLRWSGANGLGLRAAQDVRAAYRPSAAGCRRPRHTRIGTSKALIPLRQSSRPTTVLLRARPRGRPPGCSPARSSPRGTRIRRSRPRAAPSESRRSRGSRTSRGR